MCKNNINLEIKMIIFISNTPISNTTEKPKMLSFLFFIASILCDLTVNFLFPSSKLKFSKSKFKFRFF